MEKFLPGLVKLMEERLGKFGRPLTTLVVISLALGALSWGIKLFWDNLVSPISKFIQIIYEVQPITSEDFVNKVITPSVVCIMLLLIIFIIFQLIVRKTICKPSMKHVNEATKMIQEAIEAQTKTEELVQKAEQLLIKLESTLDKKDSQT